jgi:hypothetical protein
MDVEVGSNLYRNTDGMIEIEGVPQIQVALKPVTGSLLVNFALFNADGKVTAKLNDSTLMVNEQRAYEVNKTVAHASGFGNRDLTDVRQGA